MVLSLGMGVKVFWVMKPLAAAAFASDPLRKLGKLSEDLTPLPLDIAGADFLLRLLVAVVLAFLFLGTLLRLRLFDFRNLFLLPFGKKRPFSSLGRVLASFLPRATRFALFLFFLGGI